MHACTRLPLPVIAGACAFAALAAMPSPAVARANDRFAFRVDLSTGKVTALQRSPALDDPAPSPSQGTRTFVSGREGRLLVYDQRIKSPNVEVEIAPAAGRLAGQVMRGRHVVFAWRAPAPTDGGTQQYQDRIGALDLEARRILWLRQPGPAVPAALEPLGDDAVLVVHARELEIVRITTGETLRRQPLVAWAPYAHPVQGGAALLSDALSLELLEPLDRGGPRTRWRLPQVDSVGPIVPVDAPGTCAADPSAPVIPPILPAQVDWLVYAMPTAARRSTRTLTRLDPATGRLRYQVASDWLAAPCLSGDRVYEISLRNIAGTSHLTLVVRRLSDGAVLRRYPVQQHHQVDIPGARVTRATATFVEVVSQWIVLD